jgi:hypothetical protein
MRVRQSQSNRGGGKTGFIGSPWWSSLLTNKGLRAAVRMGRSDLTPSCFPLNPPTTRIDIPSRGPATPSQDPDRCKYQPVPFFLPLVGSNERLVPRRGNEVGTDVTSAGDASR